MSPRRMDISSLLCDDARPPPSPDKPRSIDALLHHPPPPPPMHAHHSPTSSSPRDTRQSQSPLATYRPSQPLPLPRTSPHVAPYPLSSPESSQHRALSSSTFALSHPYSPTDTIHPRYTFPTQPYAPLSSPTVTSPTVLKQRSPFVGLEALVHVASQERRRISGGSSPSTDRERELMTLASPLTDRPTTSGAKIHSIPYTPTTPTDHIPHGYPLDGHPHPQRHSYPIPHPDQRGSPHSFPRHREDEHPPHKRFRASRSPPPPNVDILIPSPLPPATQQGPPRSQPNTGGYFPLAPQKSQRPESHHRPYVYPPPESPAANLVGPAQSTSPVTPFPANVLHSHHAPPNTSSPQVSFPTHSSHHSSSPSYLQSPSYRSPTHSHHPLQTSPHSTSLSPPRSPVLPRDTRASFNSSSAPKMAPFTSSGAPKVTSFISSSAPQMTSFASPSVPKMVGGVSLLRDDFPPPQANHERFSSEEERPYVQVQARVPVQAPIPRFARAVWGNEADNPTGESHQLPSLQASVSNSWESEDLGPPAPAALQPQSLPTDGMVVHRETQADVPLVNLPEEPSEQPNPDLDQRNQSPSPRPISPLHEIDTEQHLADAAVRDATPIESNVLLGSEHPNKMEDDGKEPVDALPAQSTPSPPPSVTEVVVKPSPSPTPPEPPCSMSPLPDQVAVDSPERAPSQVLAVATPQPPINTVLAEDCLPATSPMESIAPLQDLQDPGPQPIDTPAEHADLPPSRLTEESKVAEQPDDMVRDTMDVDTSDLKPMPLPQSVPDTTPPEVSNVVPPEVSNVIPPAVSNVVPPDDEPKVQVKSELKLEDESKTIQPTADAIRSPTPPPVVKAEGHPDIDGTTSMPSPPATDRRSVEAVDNNDGTEVPFLMDVDIDEELLSLVEPTRRLKPVSARTGKGARETPEQELRAPAAVVDEQRDRESMPPPAPRTKGDKIKDKSASVAKKKKQDANKASAEPKQQKSRAKPTAKSKGKLGSSDAPKDASRSTISPKVSVSSARSRSTSVMPALDGKEEVTPEAEVDVSDKEDDKLYCVCKTQYDEGRVMIACDRCDDWYHTHCVNVADVEIELVDQFICPPCVNRNPELCTTWKRRCQFGLKHEDPSSPSACHKPSRGAFSKYCSDECGVKYMQQRISEWEKSGNKREVLWEVVKNAEKREGIVVLADSVKPLTAVTNGSGPEECKASRGATKRKVEWEIDRLNAQLKEAVTEREMVKRDMDIVLWREKVVNLAVQRMEEADQCGWDQRLCFGEEEWADFGAEVLESYEDKVEPADEHEAMQVDDATHCEWWCTGKKKCERHAGWQKLRLTEVSLEKEITEGILTKLTTREREIRKRIEDILYPQTSQKSPEHRLNGRAS